MTSQAIDIFLSKSWYFRKYKLIEFIIQSTVNMWNCLGLLPEYSPIECNWIPYQSKQHLPTCNRVSEPFQIQPSRMQRNSEAGKSVIHKTKFLIASDILLYILISEYIPPFQTLTKHVMANLIKYLFSCTIFYDPFVAYRHFHRHGLYPLTALVFRITYFN